MVDCNLIDIGEVNNEQRLLILDYVMRNKGVKPRDLGVTPQFINAMKHGRERVSDPVLCRSLEYLTIEELRDLLKGWVPERRATLADVVRVIKTAQVDADFREQVLALFTRYLGEYIRTASREWQVNEADIEEFTKAKRAEGLSEKSIRDEVRYIRQALAEMNWVLSPENIREYINTLIIDGEEYVLKHTTYSLKSFLKAVLQPRDPYLFGLLYNSFKVYKPKAVNNIVLPTLDQLRQIFQKIQSVEARTYFLILAEAGLRPGEPFIPRVSDVDLEHGVIHINKITETKKAFVAFLRPETLDFIKAQYLPRREQALEKSLRGMAAAEWSREYIEGLKDRFLPFDRDRLRREIKDAARQVLGREFELYELRKFFATWMVSHGVPESIVNTLQGRAPPSEYRVLIEHYWSPRHEELRKWYLEHAPCLLCQDSQG